MGFINLDQLPNLRLLQQNHHLVRQELSQVHRWIKWGSDDHDETGHCRFLSGDWTVFPVYVRAGVEMGSFLDPGVNPFLVDALIAQLPLTFSQTTAILRQVPQADWAAFSRLGARSRLAPHSHQPGTCVFHMGIAVPPNGESGLIAGDQVHIWNKDGEAVAFVDNQLHSAWNDSDSERIVLYVRLSSAA